MSKRLASILQKPKAEYTDNVCDQKVLGMSQGSVTHTLQEQACHLLSICD